MTSPPIRRRVLVVTQDVLLERMAGPAMRAWHIADCLSRDHDVRLITTSRHSQLTSRRFSVQSLGRKGLSEAEQWCDIMVLQGYVALQHSVLARTRKIVVFDIYDPLHFEILAFAKGLTEAFRLERLELAMHALNEQFKRGDFFICASERQRDLYLGQLAALGRVNPATYDDDPTLRKLIDVVPFGLPDAEPRHDGARLRGVFPGIEPHDDIIIWAGGLYNWLDPLTAIRALSILAPQQPTVKLFFMGMRHPNPGIPKMRMAEAARSLADELGLTGKHVFFNDGWVEYADRHNYLLEADIGVTTHFADVETRFAFRTRVLDYLWAKLPVVATEGDALGDLVRQRGVGLTVPPEDPASLATALLRLLRDQQLRTEMRRNAAVLREEFRWSNAVRPLAAFCASPRRAPDVNIQHALAQVSFGSRQGVRRLAHIVKHYYREGGLVEVARRAADKLAREVHW